MGKRILIIDGQGGRIGKLLVEGLKQAAVSAEVIAVGTNAIATSAMLRAGADGAATGENAIKVNCRRADAVAGPIGIVIADALTGEVSPEMARAVGQSDARKFLIPVNHCDNVIVGVPDLTLNTLVAQAVALIVEYIR